MGLNKYFIKPPKEKTVNIQMRLPMSVIKDIRPFMRDHGLTWRAMMIGTVTALLEETRKKK